MTWRLATDPPPTLPGGMSDVIAAAKTPAGAWSVFPAAHCNAYEFDSGDDEPLSGTGFFRATGPTADFDQTYEWVDALLWQPYPLAPTDDVLAAVRIIGKGADLA